MNDVLHIPDHTGLRPLCGALAPHRSLAVTYALVSCPDCLATPTTRRPDLDRVWETVVLLTQGGSR